MHHHDGGNGARARSARIRSSHDFEATHLDTMRRGTLAVEKTVERLTLVARVRATFGGLRPHRVMQETPEAPAVRS